MGYAFAWKGSDNADTANAGITWHHEYPENVMCIFVNCPRSRFSPRI